MCVVPVQESIVTERASTYRIALGGQVIKLN